MVPGMQQMLNNGDVIIIITILINKF
jgi:hypothetical protein